MVIQDIKADVRRSGLEWHEDDGSFRPEGYISVGGTIKYEITTFGNIRLAYTYSNGKRMVSQPLTIRRMSPPQVAKSDVYLDPDGLCINSGDITWLRNNDEEE